MIYKRTCTCSATNDWLPSCQVILFVFIPIW